MKILIVIVILCMLFVVPGWIHRQSESIQPTSMDLYREKIRTAILNEKVYNSAVNDNERRDLIYYFSNKLLGKGTLEEMPKVLRTMYFVDQLDMEVNNGGFLQFFTNSSGQYINETIESLSLVNAPYTKNLLEKAVTTMRKYNETPDKLNDRMSSYELHDMFTTSDFYKNEDLVNELSELDQKFYRSEESLLSLPLRYFEVNQKEVWEQLKLKSYN